MLSCRPIVDVNQWPGLLPGAIDLILSRPIVSATMIAKEVNVTPRGALNLIAELGIREMTGRGRYRAWGIL